MNCYSCNISVTTHIIPIHETFQKGVCNFHWSNMKISNGKKLVIHDMYSYRGCVIFAMMHDQYNHGNSDDLSEFVQYIASNERMSNERIYINSLMEKQKW